MIGVLGMVALVFVIVVMFKVVQNVDVESAPPDPQTDESSLSDSKPQASAEQAKPDKPPPLNQ